MDDLVAIYMPYIYQMKSRLSITNGHLGPMSVRNVLVRAPESKLLPAVFTVHVQVK